MTPTSSTNAVSFSSAFTTKRFPSWRCGSAIQIVYSNSDGDVCSYGYSYIYTDSYGNVYADSHRNTYTNADRDIYTDCNADANGYTSAYSQTKADCNAQATPNAASATVRE
jgi:hypothetical protein